MRKEKFKVIIAGGRDLDDVGMLNEECSRKLRNYENKDLEIVSGTANGADTMGEAYATSRSIQIRRFPADWDKHGKSAGYKRNEEMANYADALIAFWDGKSKGTKHMIDLARKHKLEVRVCLYPQNKKF